MGTSGGSSAGVVHTVLQVGDGSADYTTSSTSLANLGPTLSIAALTNDIITVKARFTWFATVLGNVGITVNIGGTDQTKLIDVSNGNVNAIGGWCFDHQVAAGEISGGLVVVRMRGMTQAGVLHILNSAADTPTQSLSNLGH